MLLAKVTSSFIPSGKLCASALIDNSASANGKFKGRFIGGEKWKNPRLEISRIKGNVLALVGATHLLTSVVPTEHSKYMHASEPVLYPCIISSIHEYASASVVGYGSGCSFPKIETVAFSITRVPI
jgi:hypothetical protein